MSAARARSSSEATSSSNPGVAWARCQARRSGSTSGRSRPPTRDAPPDSPPARRPIDGRAHQRVTKRHPRADREQPVGLGRRLDPDPEPPRRPPHQHRIPNRLRRRDQQQPLSFREAPRADGGNSPRSAPTTPARPANRTRPPTPPPSTPAATPTTPTGYPASQRRSARAPAHPTEPDRRAQQSAAHHHHADPRPPAPEIPRAHRPLTRHQHQRDRLRQHPPRDKHKRLRRRAIKPLRIINHTHKRPLLGRVRQQAQHRQPHQKPIRRVPHTQPKRHPQRIPLRDRKAVQAIQQRRHNCCNAANASSISDSTPAARNTRNPDADATTDSTNAVLPTPGSPHTTAPGSARHAKPQAAHPAPRAQRAGRATPPPAPR